MIIPSCANEVRGESLGGDCLEGDRIVRLVYMDEAGISNPDQEPWVVVSGVIVNADKQLIAIERHLDKIIQKYIPEEHRDGFVFHAKDLFNGGGKIFDRKKWPLEKRLEVADAVCATVKKFKIPLAFGFVERKTFSGNALNAHTPSERTIAAQTVSFLIAALHIEMWMRQNTSNEVCMLIAENNDQVRKLISDTMVTYQSRSAIEKAYGGSIPEHEANYFPLKRIKQRPLFEPKSPSSLLQLADFYAYVFKKILVLHPLYKRFYDVIWPQLIVGSVKLPERHV